MENKLCCLMLRSLCYQEDLHRVSAKMIFVRNREQIILSSCGFVRFFFIFLQIVYAFEEVLPLLTVLYLSPRMFDWEEGIKPNEICCE